MTPDTPAPPGDDETTAFHIYGVTGDVFVRPAGEQFDVHYPGGLRERESAASVEWLLNNREHDRVPIAETPFGGSA